MCDSRKRECFCEGSKKARSARKISRCARNDGGGMGLFHVAYNGDVWKALFPYRHPERSRGIFLAGGDNVVCVIAENGKPLAKEARNDGVQGRFLATLEMMVWGEMGLFYVAYNGYVWKVLFLYRHPERSPRSFLQEGIMSYV